MKQTFAPKYKPLTNDIIVARKNMFSTKVIDTIVKSIEEAIINSPERYKRGNNVLDMFADVIYDANGLKRIVKFDQYGTFYIAQVFDVYSEKYYYVVYSVYDMIDYFNNNSKQTVPYIKLYETLEDIDYKIHKVQHPLDYEGEASALNEKTKYIADFGKDKVEFYVSLQVSCASSNYVKIDSTAMQKNVCGKVKFIVGDFYSVETFCYKENEIENTEYSEIYELVTKRRNMEEFAPYGIEHWIVTYPNKPEKGELFPKDLKDVPTENGYIVFTAHLKDPFVKVNFNEDGWTATPNETEIDPYDNFITLITADEGKILHGEITIKSDGEIVFVDDIDHQKTYSVNLDKSIVESVYELEVNVTTKDNDVIDVNLDLDGCVSSNESLTAIPEEDYSTVITPVEGKFLNGELTVSIDNLEILSENVDGAKEYPLCISKEILSEANVKSITIHATSRDPKAVIIEKELTGCYIDNNANDIDADADYEGVIFPIEDGQTLNHIIVKIDGEVFIDEDISGNSSYSLSVPKEVLETITSIGIIAM